MGDLTVTVQAGCTISKIAGNACATRPGLALDRCGRKNYCRRRALHNDSGALRLRFGALRDLIIGATIALPDGTLASSGGKVVKNVAGYDCQTS